MLSLRNLLDPAPEEEPARSCPITGGVLDADASSKHPKMGFKAGEITKAAWNALHSLERMIARDEKLKKSVHALKENETLKFRNVVNTLVTDKRYSRTNADRLKVREFIIVMAEEESTVRSEDSLMYTELQYIKWKEENEGMTKTEAQQSWQKDLLDEAVHKERNKRGAITVETGHASENITGKSIDDQKGGTIGSWP